MRILLIGSGGREHALARKLLASPSVTSVQALPGSDAMECDGVGRVPGTAEDAESVRAAARRVAVDLVVIGPEAPLVAGVADALREAGFAVFGPGRDGARIEGSKAWAKAFMRRHGIPTAAAGSFDDFETAAAYIRSQPEPPVVKADGLAGGKGVTVAETHDEAVAAAHQALVDGRFGASGRRIVVEERLQGPELSVLALLDGSSRYALLPSAQDHKAVFDGGRGPNTGGMGAYSPTPFVDPATAAAVEEQILAPAAAGLYREGIDYRGVLYAGLILTSQGPRVLEFNCRFGDPETQVVLPRLAGDFGAILFATATGRLKPDEIRVSDRAAVCVILASGGYPGSYRTGYAIEGLDRAGTLPDVWIDHAGTRRDGDVWRTDGGRVLGVTALGRDPADARTRAYEACRMIRFTGLHYRRDIAAPAARD